MDDSKVKHAAGQEDVRPMTAEAATRAEKFNGHVRDAMEDKEEIIFNCSKV